ncbi:MAG TPA: hypothetical protein VG389_06270 [Myxococcota bacterium]|jgi:hypothetical protein|nr:hypothetical protein [Myxococcota bacterium]
MRSADGAGAGGAGAATTTAAAEVPFVPAEWLACAADADCVRAPADCCGCAGGGRDVALAAPWSDAWSARVGASAHCATRGACPKDPDAACAGGLRCRDGRCVLE